MAQRLGYLFWMFLAAGAATAQEPLATADALRVEVERVRTFDGVIEAVNRGTLSAQTSGRIAQIYFDVDDYVRKGEVILRFRNVEQQAAYDAATASLAEAKTRLTEAERELVRVQDVFNRKLIAQSALDRAVADRDSTKARVDAAQARFKQAQEQLEHTQVRAPYSGIVVERHVEEGESANVGQPLITGLSLDRMRVTASVPQSVVGHLRLDGAARVQLPGQSDEWFPLNRLTIFPLADSASHSVRIRGELPDGLDQLFPGMYVKLAIPVGTRSVLRVPTQAIARRSEITAVYVVDATGKIEFRQVRIGAQTDGQTEVFSGLEAGEKVALNPTLATAYLKQRSALGQ